MLFLYGCTFTYGSPKLKNMGNYLTLEKGQSSKLDVHSRFGQPYDVQPVQSGSTWVYYYGTSRIHGSTFVPFVGLVTGGNNVDTTKITVFFDDKERFSSVETQDEAQYVNQWVGIGKSLVPFENPENRVRAEMQRLNIPFDQDSFDDMRTLLRGAR
jgi:hypothetical protein